MRYQYDPFLTFNCNPFSSGLKVLFVCCNQLKKKNIQEADGVYVWSELDDLSAELIRNFRSLHGIPCFRLHVLVFPDLF